MPSERGHNLLDLDAVGAPSGGLCEKHQPQKACQTGHSAQFAPGVGAKRLTSGLCGHVSRSRRPLWRPMFASRTGQANNGSRS